MTESYIQNKPNPNTVACPNCGHGIDVNDILYHQVEHELKQQFGDQLAKEQKQFAAEREKLAKQEAVLTEATKQQQLVIDQAVEQGVRENEITLEKTLKARIKSEQSAQFEALNKELSEQNNQLKEFNRAKADIERLKREKDSLRDTIELEAEQKLNQTIAVERERIAKAQDQKSELALAERDKIIADMRNQIKEAERKAEQGSTQLQGEVQEQAIEEWLKEQFPLDYIDEIKKGVAGADCLQIVHTRDMQNCGTIYYESKRTKAFGAGWIEKFKQDIREKGADIGVLVTEAMPLDMERMGLKEGVWVCTFEEFRGLSLVLRDTTIRMRGAMISQENKGDKMGMLYDYLTGNEFRQKVEAIVEGFTQMQIDLESERRAMQSIWKKREKQIQKVLINTSAMHGEIKGIAGNAIQPVGLLELSEEVE